MSNEQQNAQNEKMMLLQRERSVKLTHDPNYDRGKTSMPALSGSENCDDASRRGVAAGRPRLLGGANDLTFSPYPPRCVQSLKTTPTSRKKNSAQYRLVRKIAHFCFCHQCCKYLVCSTCAPRCVSFRACNGGLPVFFCFVCGFCRLTDLIVSLSLLCVCVLFSSAKTGFGAAATIPGLPQGREVRGPDLEGDRAADGPVQHLRRLAEDDLLLHRLLEAHSYPSGPAR